MIRRWFKNRLAKAYLGIVICMFIILFLLAGCASTPVKEVLIKTEPIEIEIAQPERLVCGQLLQPTRIFRESAKDTK